MARRRRYTTPSQRVAARKARAELRGAMVQFALALAFVGAVAGPFMALAFK